MPEWIKEGVMMWDSAIARRTPDTFIKLKEPRMSDEYLTPVTALLGPHIGLNADWAIMAWNVSGTLDNGVFVVDCEFNNEIAIVHRATLPDGDVEIEVIKQSHVDAILWTLRTEYGRK